MLLPVLLSIVALLSAVLSAITGLGGGTVLVAVIFVANITPTVALPLHAAIQLVSNGSRTIVFARHVRWAALVFFLLSALPTPFLVAPLIRRADADWVRIALGLFVLLSIWVPRPKSVSLPLWAAMLVAGLIAGGFGTVVGATGTAMAPLFLRQDWQKETVIGTKALCQAAAHVVKIAAFSVNGFAIWHNLELVVPMSIAVLVGTLLGKRLGKNISEATFSRVFRLLISLLGLKLVGFATWSLVKRARFGA